ncbi:MAG: NUDIX hydrolase [Chloroflexota bacterium]|nr:NUDIX hydrolase [Chloroflexota bacterium]
MPGEELVRSEQIYEGRVINVRRDSIRVNKATGPVETVRDVVQTRNAVTLVPVDNDGNVLLVRQFRWAAAVALLEAPAGMMEAGEDPEESARRELREETGHATDSLTYLGGFWMAPGYSTEYMYCYLATGLRPDPLPADEDEDLETVPVPWDDIPRLIREGAIQDAKSVAALQLAYFLHAKS